MSDNANKGGRKRIPIDQKVFENLCSIQCTLAEIAAVIGCSEDTIERWCVRTYKEGFAETYKTVSYTHLDVYKRQRWLQTTTHMSDRMVRWLIAEVNKNDCDAELIINLQDEMCIRDRKKYLGKSER